MMDLPDQWTVNANVKELLHQLSSILYRCRDSANFSKRNQNNLSFDELYKLFNWDVYRCEQHQCTSTSVLERNLHQKHKDTYSQHTQTHKSIGKGCGRDVVSRPTLYCRNPHALIDHPSTRFILYTKRISNSILTVNSLRRTHMQMTV